MRKTYGATRFGVDRKLFESPRVDAASRVNPGLWDGIPLGYTKARESLGFAFGSLFPEEFEAVTQVRGLLLGACEGALITKEDHVSVLVDLAVRV